MYVSFARLREGEGGAQEHACKRGVGFLQYRCLGRPFTSPESGTRVLVVVSALLPCVRLPSKYRGGTSCMARLTGCLYV